MSDTPSFPHPSRRTVLGGAAALGLASAAIARSDMATGPATIVSTWDFGAAANKAAFEKLSAGGSILDAVEAGGRVPEADPTNHSVG